MFHHVSNAKETIWTHPQKYEFIICLVFLLITILLLDTRNVSGEDLEHDIIRLNTHTHRSKPMLKGRHQPSLEQGSPVFALS